MFMSIPPIVMRRPNPDDVFMRPHDWEEVTDPREAKRLASREPIVVVSEEHGMNHAASMDGFWMQNHPHATFGFSDGPRFFRQKGPMPMAGAQHYQHRSALKAKMQHMAMNARIQQQNGINAETTKLVILGAHHLMSSSRNNGYVSNYPSYKGLFCTGDALRTNGASSALDAVGIIPGGGNLLHGIQLGAGITSAGISVFGEARDAALSAGGLGLAFADKAGASIALHGTELIPIAGNILSGVSTYYDVKALAATYKSCMAGGKYD
jgi:hypothetical protein